MEKFEVPESVVLNSCLGLLNLMGIFAWRNNTGAYKAKSNRTLKERVVYYGKKGSADIIGILPDGRFLAVECKRESGKASPDQLLFLSNIKANKGVACIVHSCDELMEVLKKEGVVNHGKAN